MPTFYRIVPSDRPTSYDFLPLGKQGRPLPRSLPPSLRASWFDVISVYSTLEAARKTARRFPRLGRFIASLEIPETGRFFWAQSGDVIEHYDLIGDANELLACVTKVVQLLRRGDMTYFELWDLGGRNMIGTYRSLDSALVVVRELLATGYAGYRTDLALGETQDDGSEGLTVEGDALVELALARTPAA